MEIYFVRHGQAMQETDDGFLTEQGILQAEKLARRLSSYPGKKFNEFYTSNLTRAKQTGDIVSKTLKLKPIIEPSLNEFQAEFIKQGKSKMSGQDKKHYTNLVSFLEKITHEPNQEKRILIICHGVTNRIILSYLLDLDFKNLIYMSQENTGINSAHWTEKHKNWRVDYWNNYSHLD